MTADGGVHLAAGGGALVTSLNDVMVPLLDPQASKHHASYFKPALEDSTEININQKHRKIVAGK